MVLWTEPPVLDRTTCPTPVTVFQAVLRLELLTIPVKKWCAPNPPQDFPPKALGIFFTNSSTPNSWICDPLNNLRKLKPDS